MSVFTNRKEYVMRVLIKTRKRWRKHASRKRRSFKKPTNELYDSWKKHRRR